jgi:twinkle protein
MTSLVSHVGTSEANELLNTIMGEIASMVEELDFNFIYYSHLNPPKTGPSHERGGKVHENQLTGSRAMIKWSHYIIGLERNKDPDLPEYERNTTTVVLLKDREFGNVGKFRIFYDKETGDLVEMFS